MTELRKRTLLFSALFTIFIGVSVAIFLPSERAIQAMILTGYADNNSTISDSDKEVIRKTIENKTK